MTTVFDLNASYSQQQEDDNDKENNNLSRSLSSSNIKHNNNNNNNSYKNSYKNSNNTEDIIQQKEPRLVHKPEDAPVLQLKQFAEKPFADFGTVKVGTAARVELLISNDTTKEQELVVDRLPTDSFFTMNDVYFQIDPDSSIIAPIIWKPQKEGSFRKSLIFKWNKRYRLQVTLYGQSVIKSSRKRLRSASSHERPRDSNRTPLSPLNPPKRRRLNKPNGQSNITSSKPQSNTKTHGKLKKLLSQPVGIPAVPARRPTRPQEFQIGAHHSASRNSSAKSSVVSNSTQPGNRKTTTKSTNNYPKNQTHFRGKNSNTTTVNDSMAEFLDITMPDVSAQLEDHMATPNGSPTPSNLNETINLSPIKSNDDQVQKSNYNSGQPSTLTNSNIPSKLKQSKNNPMRFNQQPSLKAKAKRGRNENNGASSADREKRSAQAKQRAEYIWQQRMFGGEIGEIGLKNWFNFVIDEPISNIDDTTNQPTDKIQQISNQAVIHEQARKLFTSELVQRIIGHVEDALNQKRISVSQDYSLFWFSSEFQDLILHNFMQYRPVWLRLALRSVFPTVDPSQRQSLESIIMEHVYTCPNITKRQNSSEEEYFEQQFSHFISSAFSIVVLLDIAYQRRIMGVNGPSLFLPNAQVKNGRDIITSIGKSVGLPHLFCTVEEMGHDSVIEHVQEELENYDFHVESLRTSLKDGIRLGRLLDILLPQKQFFKQVRLPVFSRSDRLHNLRTILKQLQQLGIQTRKLYGGIRAEHIIDGKIDKICALLSTLVERCHIPIAVDTNLLNEEIQRLQKEQETHKLPGSSIFVDSEASQALLQWIQAATLSYNIGVSNFTKSLEDGKALCYLISFYAPEYISVENIKPSREDIRRNPPSVSSPSPDPRGVLTFSPPSEKHRRDIGFENEKHNWNLVKTAIAQLGGIPNVIAVPSEPQLPNESLMMLLLAYLSRRLIIWRRQNVSASQIQKSWKLFRAQQKRYQIIQNICQLQLLSSNTERNQFLKVKESIMTIKSRFHFYLCSTAFNENRAATKIQALSRGALDRKECNLFLDALSKIQASAYMKICTSRFFTSRNAIRTISNGLETFQKSKFRKDNQNSIDTIQSAFHRFLDHTSAVEDIKSIQVLQGFALTVQLSNELSKRRNAIKTIQATSRTALAFQRRHNISKAILALQSSLRAINHEQAHYSNIKAIRILQGLTLTQQFNNQHLKDMDSITTIQSGSRRSLAVQRRQQVKRAVSLLQASLQAFHYNKDRYYSNLRAVRVLQGLTLTQQSNTQRLKDIAAIKTIQSSTSGALALGYRKQIVNAIITLQASFKAFQHTHTHRSNLRALKTIQGSVSTYHLNNQRLNDICSINTIQSSSSSAMEFRLRKQTIHAVSILQSGFRTSIHECIHQYDKSAIDSIRSALLMKRESCSASSKINAITTIQSSSLCGGYHHHFQLQRSAIKTIQSFLRMAPIQLQHIKQSIPATLAISSFGNMIIERRQFSSIRVASSSLSTMLRMKKFSAIQNAISKLNSLYESYHLRCRFLSANQSVTIITNALRMSSTSKLHRLDNNSTKTIQSFMSMIVQRNHFVNVLAEERAERARQLEQAERLRIENAAAIQIQSVLRMRQGLIQAQQRSKRIILLQRLVRGYQVRKIRPDRVAEVAQRLDHATNMAQEDKKLGNRTTKSLNVLLSSNKMGMLMHAIENLDTTTKFSAPCCERLAYRGAVPVILQVVRSCNRSKPHVEVVKHAVCILIHLARHSATTSAVMQEKDLTDILVELFSVHKDNNGVVMRIMCLFRVLCSDTTRCRRLVLGKQGSGDPLLLRRLRSIASHMQRKTTSNRRYYSKHHNSSINHSDMNSSMISAGSSSASMLNSSTVDDVNSSSASLNSSVAQRKPNSKQALDSVRQVINLMSKAVQYRYVQ